MRKHDPQDVPLLRAPVSRRRFLYLAGIAGGAAALTPPGTGRSATGGTSAAYRGKRLVVYSYGGVWDEAVKAGAVNPMKARYEGLEIVIDPAGGFTKLLAEKDHPQADVSFIDDSAMPQAIALGMLLPLDLGKIPSAKDVYPQGKLFDSFGLAMEFGRLGIAYRKDNVKSPPTSWADLWRPEYKGKVAIGAPSPGGTAWVQFLVAAARLAGGSEDNLDPGFTKLKELKPNLLTVTETTGQVTQLLTSGDLWITHFWDGRTISMKRTGVPIEFADPKEGSYATITYAAVLKASKLPELGHEFVERMLSLDGQVAFGKHIGYGPTNAKVKIPDEYIREGVLFGKDQVERMRILDWKKMAPKRAEWLEKWNDAVR